MKSILMRTFTKPKTLLISLSFLFALNLFVFGQAGAIKESPIESLAQIFGWIVQIGTFLVIVAGIVWWVFWGRDKEQIKEQAAGWKDTAERYRTENAELKAKSEERKNKITELRKARQKDRVLIYRMVARLENQEIDIDDLGELWEEI